MDQTIKFLDILHNDKTTFRFIQEDEKGKKIFSDYGLLNLNSISYYNKSGCGIFFLVNSSFSKETKNNDIQELNAVFIDIDENDLPTYFPIPPSAIVSREDNKGHHVYWFLTPTDNFEDWRTAQKIVIGYYNSDPSIKNLGRLMRIPGTINNKPKRNKQKYLIQKLNETRYNLKDIITAHTDVNEIKKGLAKFANAMVKKNNTDLTERGAVNQLMIQLVMRMHGLNFNEADIFKELKGINKKYCKNIFSDADIKHRIKAREYAKNDAGEELKQELEKEIAKQEGLQKATEDWYFIQKSNSFIHMKDMDMRHTKQGFNLEFGKLTNLTDTYNYCQNRGLIKIAEDLVYEPLQDQILPRKIHPYVDINSYRNDRVKPLKGKKENYIEFINHIKYLLPTKNEHDYFFDWLAFAVQNPRQKIYHGFLLMGKQGVGKTILTPLFKQLFGPSNVCSPQNENLGDKFTKWARNTLFCIINELKQDDKYKFYNTIKPFLSDTEVEIREMYREPYSIKNYMNVLAYSNEELPIRMAKDDRRWYITKSPAERKPDDYYKKLSEYLKINAAYIMQWLLERDINNFNFGQHPKITKAKQIIIDESRPELDLWVEEKIKHATGIFEKDIVCIAGIRMQLELEEARYRNDTKITNKYLARLLRLNNAQVINKAIRIGENVNVYYIIRHLDKYIKHVNDNTITKIVKEIYT